MLRRPTGSNVPSEDSLPDVSPGPPLARLQADTFVF